MPPSLFDAQCEYSDIFGPNLLKPCIKLVINNILNAVAHLQLEGCTSSQNLFKHPTNKNHHNYLQKPCQIHFNMKFIKPSKIK